MNDGGGSRGKPEQRGVGWSRQTSVATRLGVAVLVVSMLPLLVSILIAVGTAVVSGESVLRNRLSLVGSSKAAELSSYGAEVEGTVRALASSRMAIEAVQSFALARNELSDLAPSDVQIERKAVARFYLEEFVPALEEIRGEPVDVLQFDPGDDPAAAYLQSAYIAENPLPIEEKRLLTDAEDGSRWSEVHEALHPTLRATVDRFGFEDLFLIDAEEQTVVYSTNKDATFATDLNAGSHSGTTLARLVDRVVETAQPGVLLASDFAVYPPALDQPVAFVAAPLFDDGQLVGVLAVGLPVDRINELLARDWREGTGGETGEIYLVGPDLRMRSDSRAFQEDPSAYLARIEELGNVDDVDRSRMASLGTTVLFQTVDTDATRAANEGGSGVVSDVNYLGQEVYTAYAPVENSLFDWVLLAEQGRDEADAPIVKFTQESLVVTAVFVVGITFFAVAWASSFVDPLRAISASLVRIRQGEEHVALPARGAREFRVLASGLDDMVVGLDRRKAAVTTALESKVQLLRTLLPPAAAERVGRGDRKVVETVAEATVAALVIDGLEEAFRDRDAEGNRDLVHAIVDEADSLAAVNGLERVTLAGDVYYAACGLSTPYVDHAPRSVAFVLRLQDEMRRLAKERGVELGVTAGINSGPVTSGLIGGSRLIYDLWGDTVEDAYRIVRAARAGQVLITGSTRARMPAGTATEPVDVVPGMETWLVGRGEQAGVGE